LELFDLFWLEIGEVEGEPGGADDGGCFGDDEDGGGDAFEGVVEAVDALAFASAAK
jgi:hypothetical protein